MNKIKEAVEKEKERFVDMDILTSEESDLLDDFARSIVAACLESMPEEVEQLDNDPAIAGFNGALAASRKEMEEFLRKDITKDN